MELSSITEVTDSEPEEDCLDDEEAGAEPKSKAKKNAKVVDKQDKDDDAGAGTKPKSKAKIHCQSSAQVQEDMYWIGETGSSSSNSLQLNLRQTSNGPVTMEVFSGSGNLSTALAAQDFHTNSIDLAIDQAHDMSKTQVSDALAQHAERHSTFYTHMAPPCNSYSVARRPRLRTAMIIPPPLPPVEIVEHKKVIKSSKLVFWSSPAFYPRVKSGAKANQYIVRVVGGWPAAAPHRARYWLNKLWPWMAGLPSK